MALDASVFANPGERFARFGMAVSRAVAGFALDILEVSGQVFFGLSVSGGVALQATGIGSLILSYQGLVGSGMSGLLPALMLLLMARKAGLFTHE